jgi:hypothetical protein
METNIKQEKIEVPPGRLELPAQGLGIPCSIRLSYGGTSYFQALGYDFVMAGAGGQL